MTRLLHRPKRDEDVLLDACATSRPTSPAPTAAAAHLSRRRDRDRPIGFADVATYPDPEWADAAPGRYEVAGLVPAGQLAAVPLTPALPPRFDDPRVSPLPIEEQIERAQHVMRSRDIAFEAVITEDREGSAKRRAAMAAASWIDDTAGAELAESAAAVLDAVAARPGLRHDTALLMALAPIVAQLKGVEL